MSVSPNAADVQNPSYEPDGQTPAEVYVSGVRIPVVEDGATVRMRKSGDASLTRTASVTYPSYSHGTSWYEFVDEYDTATVLFRDHATDELRPVMRGYVATAGGGQIPPSDSFAIRDAVPQTPIRMRIQDPAKLLPTKRVNKRFQQPQLSSVLSFIDEQLTRLESTIGPIDVETDLLQVRTGTRTFGSGRDIPEPPNPGQTQVDSAAPGSIDTPVDASPRRLSSKTFRENTDTIADVVAWATEQLNATYWFEPESDGGFTFVISDSPASYRLSRDRNRGFIFDSALGGGDDVAAVDILENTSLPSINPVNTVVAVGGTVTSRGSTYPYAIAVARPLYERANEEPYITYVEDTDVTSVEPLRGQAEHALNEAIGGAGEGSIITRHTPRLQPYSALTALPSVATEIQNDVEPLTYEVESAVMNAQAGGFGTAAWTKVKASLRVDRVNGIELVDSGTLSVDKSRNINDIIEEELA